MSIPLAAVIFLAYNSGPPSGYTGSPGDNNHYCTACHSPANTYNVSAQLTTDIPATGYVPGQTYHLTLQPSSASNKHGFEMTAENANRQKAGAFSNTDGNTQTLNAGQYIAHTSSGTRQSQWNFTWQAPASGQGTITFYAAINATNADNSSSGDTPALFHWSFAENTTAVREKTIPGIMFYPNPVKEQLYLKANKIIDRFEIYDLKGRRVYHSENLVFPVSMQSYPKGQYIIKVKSEGKVGIYKILKE